MNLSCVFHSLFFLLPALPVVSVYIIIRENVWYYGTYAPLPITLSLLDHLPSVVCS